MSRASRMLLVLASALAVSATSCPRRPGEPDGTYELATVNEQPLPFRFGVDSAGNGLAWRKGAVDIYSDSVMIEVERVALDAGGRVIASAMDTTWYRSTQSPPADAPRSKEDAYNELTLTRGAERLTGTVASWTVEIRMTPDVVWKFTR